jgi:TonB family protein
MKTNQNLIALSLALTCFLAGSSMSAVNAGWQKQLEGSAFLIHTGHYAKAAEVVDQAIAEMVAKIGGNEADDRMFATALVHKALASAGVGNLDDALWYWYVAQEVSPAVAKMDLAPFGAPGEYLANHPFAQPDQPVFTTPVKVVKQVPPSFPRGASRFGIQGDLVVQIVVDRNGQPTLPHIVRSLPAPTLSYVALEALRHWRFEPATRNGAAVPAVFNLSVHYKL